MSGLLRTILLVCREFFYLIFPLSADETVVRDVSVHQFLDQLSVQHVQNVTCLSRFKNPSVRAVVHLVKFHRHQKAISLAGAILETYLQAHHHQPVIVIPIPLSTTRKRERGFNQAELIAQSACSNLQNATLRTDILKRVKHTKAQTSLSKKDRLQNVHDAFAVISDTTDLRNTEVILFDDVLTTGATLSAAKAQLLPHSPKRITCVALAH